MQSNRVVQGETGIFTKLAKVHTFLVPLLLLAISGLLFVFTLVEFSKYNLPPGGDQGDWIALAHGLCGNSYPLWNRNPWGYPPLFAIIYYVFANLTNDLVTIKLSGPVLIALMPLSTFFLAKEITRNNYSSLFIAAITATFPSYYEMLAWGGYTNILGFLLLPLAILSVLKLHEKPMLTSYLRTTFFIMLVVLSHHITSLIMFFSLMLWSLYLIVSRKDAKHGIFALVMALASLLIYYGVIIRNPQYIIFNEAAWYRLALTSEKVIFVFKNWSLLLILIPLSALGFVKLYRERRQTAVLLLVWLVLPFLFQLTHPFRIIAIDSVRLLFFSIQPAILLSAYSITGITKIFHERRPSSKKIPYKKVVVTAICLGLIAGSFQAGMHTLSNASRYWVFIMTCNPNSDSDAFEVINWVKKNTEATDVIVTYDHVIGRWIQGLAHRRVIYHLPPQFIFIPEYFERTVLGVALLSSNIIGQNAIFRVKDQVPLLHDFTPRIYLYHQGDYEFLGYLSDGFLQINTTWGVDDLELDHLISIQKGYCSYMVQYLLPNFEVTRIVDLSKDEAISIDYYVRKRSEVEIISVSFPLWLPWGSRWDYDGKMLRTSIGDVEILTNADNTTMMIDPRLNQTKIQMEFKPRDGEMNLHVKLIGQNMRMTKEPSFLYTVDEIVKKYDITHILIRKDDIDAEKLLLNDRRWVPVYENQVYVIYCLKSSHGDGAK